MDKSLKNMLILVLPVICLVGASIVLYRFLIYRKFSYARGLMADEISVADFGWCILAVICSVVIMLMFVKVFPMEKMYDENVRMLADSFSMGFLSIYFIPNAFYEELIFRGCLQVVLGFIPAAVLFTLVHVSYLKKPVLVLEVFIQALILGGLYVITGSVWLTTIAHTAVNTIQIWLIKTDRIKYNSSR